MIRLQPLKWLLFFWLAIGLLGLIIDRFFIFNTSPSMPIGLYRLHHVNHYQSGNIVAVCLNSADQSFGLARGYITKALRCHGSEPLVKKIIAIPGDTVLLTHTGMTVNGDFFPAVALNQDSQHRSISPYPAGYYPNTQAYWLLGTHDSHSWDSRYLGPVSFNQLLGTLTPIWLWHDQSN